MSEGRWWDHDPDERPIPVDAVAAPVERAEEIVEQERRALAREDTEPTVQTLALQAATSRYERKIASVSAPALGVALLLAGCIVMFLLGWSAGSKPRAADGRSVAEATSMKHVFDSHERSIPGIASDEHKEVSEK